jgi:hypothetical protein
MIALWLGCRMMKRPDSPNPRRHQRNARFTSLFRHAE